MTFTPGKIEKDIEVCSLQPQRKNTFWSNEYRRDINMGGLIICSTP